MFKKILDNFRDNDPLEKLEKMNMKFDCVVGNPPYQENVKGGNANRDLWPKFVDLSIEITKENGYICLVHPSRWRSPEHELWEKMKKLQIMYLEIHNKFDGIKIFGATTRYDWYIIKNCKNIKPTNIKNEIGEEEVIDITKLIFLPNFATDEIVKIIATDNEEKCNVLYSRSIYGTDKKNMTEEQNEKNKYPCVYSMYKDGSVKFWYSSEKKDYFDMSKVIMTCAEHPYPLIDIEGKYGICQNAFAISVNSKEEAEGIKNAVTSDRFKRILIATKWNNFQIDYRMFKYFRKDFWKEFI
jgi:hypothetical protein